MQVSRYSRRTGATLHPGTQVRPARGACPQAPDKSALHYHCTSCYGRVNACECDRLAAPEDRQDQGRDSPGTGKGRPRCCILWDMNYRHLHEWAVTPGEAVEIQQRLRSQVVPEGEPENVRYIAGVDVGLRGETMRAAAVVLDYPGLNQIEGQIVEQPVTFPYAPGPLSFREAPAVLEALRSLRHEPDLIVVDGQGIAHPRRLGIAAHLGLLVERPTIGCAKSILTGRHEPVGPAVGDGAPLLDRGRPSVGRYAPGRT